MKHRLVSVVAHPSSRAPSLPQEDTAPLLLGGEREAFMAEREKESGNSGAQNGRTQSSMKGEKHPENNDFWDRSEQMEKWSCRKANWEAAKSAEQTKIQFILSVLGSQFRNDCCSKEN